MPYYIIQNYFNTTTLYLKYEFSFNMFQFNTVALFFLTILGLQVICVLKHIWNQKIML